MEEFLAKISENSSKHICVPLFSKNHIQLNPKHMVWGGELRKLLPSKLITAFNYLKDPLMVVAGQAYVSTQVRDTSFQIQEKALQVIRGNRKLTKANISDGLSTMSPTEEQTKRVALILFELFQVQTISFDADKKSLWTVPSDLRKWSFSSKTIWVDAQCQHMIDWSGEGVKEPNVGTWLSDREEDGWEIEWPIAEGGFEEIKQKVIDRNVTPRVVLGERIKKEHWAKTLGKCETIEYLLSSL